MTFYIGRSKFAVFELLLAALETILKTENSSKTHTSCYRITDYGGNIQIILRLWQRQHSQQNQQQQQRIRRVYAQQESRQTEYSQHTRQNRETDNGKRKAGEILPRYETAR